MLSIEMNFPNTSLVLRRPVRIILFFVLLLARAPLSAGLLDELRNRAPGADKPRTGPIFKRAASGFPDTLEIFIMYAEFQEEIPSDNPSTTGKGTFNSAVDSSFTLDPWSSRKHRYYLENHLLFARDYFQKVSKGRLYITWEIFPRPESGSGEIKNPYQLSGRMASYNPTRKDQEKNVVFYERKAQALMSFVSETIRLADADRDSALNPFVIPKSTSPNKFRSYLIFHAGHNGLIDGGQLGQLGADTPNDIIDFFATPDDFALLKELPENGNPSRLEAHRGDSLGIPVSNGDTVSQVMILSESASQDKVNFGINGILVNQIARQIGMPDTWDRGTGFTRLGYLDLMDVGHLSMSGFIPVYPSAWLRVFMGWEEPITARPGAGGSAEYSLSSPLWGMGTLSVKVPVNDREYLLVENRQKSLEDSITVYFRKKTDKNDHAFSLSDSIRVSVDFIDSLFMDSICNSKGKNCKENKRRPRGVITGVSTYEMGLPGAGLAVWHVNEWFIEEAVRYGFVNASDNESKELSGLSLVEADGELSIGKEGKDQLGQSVFDFGSGSDMLPHIHKYADKIKGADTTWKRDTIRFITPWNFANTGSWNDGRTHIVLEAVLPDIRKKDLVRGINFLTGDSIFTFQDTSITLKIHWNLNPDIQQKAYWQWPVQIPAATHMQSLAFLSYPDSVFLTSVSDLGFMQVFNAGGAGAVPPFDTVHIVSAYDSLETLLPSGLDRDTAAVSVYSMGRDFGKPIGSAVLSDTVLCFLSKNGRLYFRSLIRDSVTRQASGYYSKTSVDAGGVLGPMVIGSRVWVISALPAALSYDAQGRLRDSIPLPNVKYHSMGAAEHSGRLRPVLAASGGRIVAVDPAVKSAEFIIPNAWSGTSEKFSISASDFDQEGGCDLLLLGSRGAVHIVTQEGTPYPNFPMRFERFAWLLFEDSVLNEQTQKKELKVTDTVLTEDSSPPAIADIDGDGHPDFIFTAKNSLMAVNYRGVVLEGWPFVYEPRQDVGLLYSSPSNPGTVIRSTPLVISLDGETTIITASPDGLVWAVNSKGKALASSGYDASREENSHSGILSAVSADWPLSSGGLNFDTADVPYIQLAAANTDGEAGLELFAQTGTGSISCWSLTKAALTPSAGWSISGGNVMRHHFFDASALDPASSGEVSIIRDFHFYPSPLEGAQANIFIDIGAQAARVRIRIYDLAGMVVKEKTMEGTMFPGPQPASSLNLSHLGPDVYTALLEVWFDKGGRKEKWTRFGVIR